MNVADCSFVVYLFASVRCRPWNCIDVIASSRFYVIHSITFVYHRMDLISIFCFLFCFFLHVSYTADCAQMIGHRCGSLRLCYWQQSSRRCYRFAWTSAQTRGQSVRQRRRQYQRRCRHSARQPPSGKTNRMTFQIQIHMCKFNQHGTHFAPMRNYAWTILDLPFVWRRRWLVANAFVSHHLDMCHRHRLDPDTINSTTSRPIKSPTISTIITTLNITRMRVQVRKDSSST